MGDYPKQAGFDTREMQALKQQSDEWRAKRAAEAEARKGTTAAERKKKAVAAKGDYIEQFLLANESKEVKSLYRQVKEDGMEPGQIAGLMMAMIGKVLEAGRKNEIEWVRVYTAIPKFAETMRRCIGVDKETEAPAFQGLIMPEVADSNKSDEVVFQ